MPLVHAIDTHPQRQKIVDAILSGESSRSISAWTEPHLGHNAIHRYKAHVVRPAISKSVALAKVMRNNELVKDEQLAEQVTAVAKEEIRVSPFRDRLEILWGKTEKAIARAETAVRAVTDHESGELVAVGSDVSAIAPLLNQAHKNLEILGRATGELDSSPQVVNNTVVMALPGDPRIPQSTIERAEVIECVATPAHPPQIAGPSPSKG